jgi:hypothetical protein
MAARGLIVLAVSGIIVMFVMNFETNANKHIHVPEYILMPHDDFNGHACAGAVGGGGRHRLQMTLQKNRGEI